MSLKIVNLSQRYDNLWVLRDISLEVKSGEILGLFGLSGVGKSTLIRALAGLNTNCGGRILLDDDDLTEKPSRQRPIYFPTLTTESYWRALFKTHTEPEIADGEGQILAFENALSKAENVLLLDNNFCEMDWQTRQEKYAELRSTVREKNLKVIFATNTYHEVFEVCDRVAVMVSGEIRQTGTPREVYENPTSVSVARVFGKNNLIEARRLTSSKAEIPEFQTISGEHRLFTARPEKQSLGAINQNVTLAIRPEHISISFGASFPEDNLLKAVVTGIQFLGETTQILLDANGLMLQSVVLRLVGLNIGDECMVGLPPDRILVFKD